MPDRMLLFNARVIEGTGQPPRERSVVRVDGDRIADVGTADGAAPAYKLASCQMARASLVTPPLQA